MQGKDGPRKLLDLTEEGRKALKALGWSERSRKANESIEHAFMKNHIAEFLRKHGWEALVEARVGGHYPDIHAQKAGLSLVVEVERGESEFWKNILKNLEAGHDIVASLPLRRDLKDRIERKVETLPQSERERVKVLVQQEFYRWLPGLTRRPF